MSRRTQIDRIQHELEGAKRLSTELRPKAEQHYASVSMSRLHENRASQYSALSAQPAARQQVRTGVAGNHVHFPIAFAELRQQRNIKCLPPGGERKCLPRRAE